jgi:hypothetical protein
LVESETGELSLLYWQTEPVAAATSAGIPKAA